WDEEKGSAERAVEKESEKVGAGEGARTKKLEGHHGMTAPSFEKNKCDDENESGNERCHNRRMGKAETCRFNQTPDKRAKAESDDNCPQPIETPFFIAGTFRDAPTANDDDQDGERELHQKDPAPTEL